MGEEYNLKDWETKEVELLPIGKAPKKYGIGVYKFGAAMTLSVILPRRGWELIKKSKHYVYLKPPPNENPPFKVKIKIPNKVQALEMANSCYESAESWLGQVGEWPAWYTHERVLKSYEITPSTDGFNFEKQLTHTFPAESSLNIGEYGFWSVELKKIEGDFSYTAFGNVKDDVLSEHTLDTFTEGQELQIELTKYERNPEARAKCIEYYGSYCQVCNFDFSKTYGHIGTGFIHVHHLNPISSSNGQYEIDPIKDLIPLCPNCHSMIHKKDPPFTVQELKSFLL